jgi:5-methylcytosine-specific restriction endonuclease McrA
MTYTYKYKQMRQAILKRDDHTCQYCGQPGNQIDHIIPISKGGEDHETNMATACATCNASKKNQDAQKFQEKRYSKRFFESLFPRGILGSLSHLYLRRFKQDETR